MTDWMVVRCDKISYMPQGYGWKWREMGEAILISTPDHGKWVKRVETCCLRVINQPCHIDTCFHSHLPMLTSKIDQRTAYQLYPGGVFVVR